MAVKAKTKKVVRKKSGQKNSVSAISANIENVKPVSNILQKIGLKYVVLGIFLFLLLALMAISKGLFVAAMVDGKPISRLKLIKTLEKESGKQALDSLVTKELILQEARDKNISVSLQDIQPDLDAVTNQLEAEGTTLDAALAVRGLTKESFEENLKMQKVVEKMLEAETSVTDDEINQYFEENKDFYGKDAKYEDLKEDLRLQLKQTKLETEYQKLYEKLKSESDIKYFVNF